jgi:hypothetical protein
MLLFGEGVGMIPVCLFIIGLAAPLCYTGAEAIGDCITYPDLIYCEAQPEAVPLRASWYDPALGGTNCLDPCHLTANGTAVEDCYNVCLACPGEWIGNTFIVDGVGIYPCTDTGTAIIPGYGEVFTSSGFVTEWFITVDFMATSPPWFAYELLEWEMVTG